MYVDDTSVITKADSMNELKTEVSEVLQCFEDSCWGNFLILNKDKTVLIEFALLY